MMKQAQELAAGSQGQLPLPAGSSAPQAQCVLLAAGQAAASSDQQQAGVLSTAATSGTAATAAAGRQTRVAFSAKRQPTAQQSSGFNRSASPPLLAANDGYEDIEEGAAGGSYQPQR